MVFPRQAWPRTTHTVRRTMERKCLHRPCGRRELPRSLTKPGSAYLPFYEEKAAGDTLVPSSFLVCAYLDLHYPDVYLCSTTMHESLVLWNNTAPPGQILSDPRHHLQVAITANYSDDCWHGASSTS